MEEINADQNETSANRQRRRRNAFESPFRAIEEGQSMPDDLLETIPFSTYGLPLPESENTFVVVNRGLSFFPKRNAQKCGKLFRFSNRPSFLIFEPSNLVRRLALYSYTHPVFEITILLTIIGNALFMSFNAECPVAEYTFLAIYTVEALIKLVARGVAYHPHTYLTDAWNWLDLLVLTTSYVVMIVQLVGSASFANLNLQAFRTFRLLRMITILPGLQSIVKALLLAVRKLVGVLAFVAFFMMVFALFGIELFAGDLRNKCVAKWPAGNLTNKTWTDWTADEEKWSLDNLGNFQVCGNVSGAQKCPTGFRCINVASSTNPMNDYLSFDNFLMALIAVFIVMTGDYWEEEYRAVLSANGPWASLYFFFVVILGAFYLMNLILSVVALSYSTDKEEDKVQADEAESLPPICEEDEVDSLDDGRIEDISEVCVESEKVPEPVQQSPGNLSKWLKFRRLLRSLVESSKFDIFITFVILINTMAMAVVHQGMPQWLAEVTDILNNICALIFAIEAILKIMGLGAEYFKNKWNLLDFFVVIGSIFDAISTYGLQSNTTLNTTAIRLLRLLRILKLAQSWRTMRILLEIIFHAISSLANLTIIMACIVFIFALVGMQLFSGTYTEEQFGESIPRWNFDGLMRSLLTVFRILCRDAVEPMLTCFRANGMAKCMPVFLGTLIFGTFIVLNLFLALLLMAFSSDDLKPSENEDLETSQQKPTLLQRFKSFFEACRSCRKPSSSQQQQPENFARQSIRVTVAAVSKAQLRARFICEHKAFEFSVLGLIFISSALLCLNDIYLVEGSNLDIALSILDNIFLALFTAEFLLKLLAYGFKSCFTQFWLLLDFVIIATGFIDLGLTHVSSSKSNNLLALRCIRCIRCLRPLRAISRWEGMRKVVDALVRTIPGIGNVLLVVVVFWLVFAIVGVQFFAGRFARCIDIASGNRLPTSLIPNRQVCENDTTINTTRRWANPTINFDNVLAGYLALLQIATFESWTDILEAAVDVPDHLGDQPARELNLHYALFIAIFIVFGSFFLLNLFIGVIVDTFNELKKETLEIRRQTLVTASALEVLMTDDQLEFSRNLKQTSANRSHRRRMIPKPDSSILAIFYKLAKSPIFEAQMSTVILLSCVAMATEHFGQSELFTKIQEYLNIVFTGLFAIEAAIKLLGFRFHYFREAWNVFDFTLVVWSLVTLALDDQANMKSMPTSSLLRALRVLRVGRLIRLVRSMKSVQALILSLMSSLPALFNVGCLLTLIIFIFSVVGMILFGRIRHQSMITDVVNFETFGNSFLLLFRLSTMAGWDGILTAMSLQPENVERGGCDPNNWRNPVTGQVVPYQGGDCGSPNVAAVYLTCFLLISNFVLTNLFVAVILENLDEAFEKSTKNND